MFYLLSLYFYLNNLKTSISLILNSRLLISPVNIDFPFPKISGYVLGKIDHPPLPEISGYIPKSLPLPKRVHNQSDD